MSAGLGFADGPTAGQSAVMQDALLLHGGIPVVPPAELGLGGLLHSALMRHGASCSRWLWRSHSEA